MLKSVLAASAEASFSAGNAAEQAGNPAAIDYYYAAAAQTWPLHVAGAATPGDAGSGIFGFFGSTPSRTGSRAKV